jgi:hypothetical protein
MSNYGIQLRKLVSVFLRDANSSAAIGASTLALRLLHNLTDKLLEALSMLLKTFDINFHSSFVVRHRASIINEITTIILSAMMMCSHHQGGQTVVGILVIHPQVFPTFAKLPLYLAHSSTF